MKDMLGRIRHRGTQPDARNAQVSQFDQFEASTLYCRRCKKAVPVRKKLLLALPNGDKYDYLCSLCGDPIGSKMEEGEMPNLIIR